MAGKADLRAMFKAARGQRDTAPGKLTKEQLRQLRAQRILQQENTEAHASAPVANSITASTEELPAQHVSKETRSVMPPPPPKVGMASSIVRPPPQGRQSLSDVVKSSAAVASAPGPHKPVPFKPDSQLSRDSTNRAGSVLSDASTGAVAHASAAPNNVAESSQMGRQQNGVAEVGLPSGFFEAEAAVSEGGSAADNPPGQATAYFSDEALSDKASIADHSPAAASAVRGAPGVPPGFFEAEDPRSTHTRSVEDETDPSPVQYNASATSNPSANQGVLPKGFFASSEAEAQARGAPPSKKKTKAETIDEFMASIAEDVRGVEEREQAEAEEAAVERINKEAFEQKMRLQRIAELRAKKVPTSALPDVMEVPAAVLPEELRGSLGKRKRPAFSYEAALEGVTADEDEEDDDEDEVLDWRSKAVA